VWGIGYVFKFSSESIWEMDMKELLFWNKGTGKIEQWVRAGV